MISVILPVYNCAAYVSASIQSILDQSYSDFEFIIINDGSSDNTAEVISQFNDSRIRYVELPENAGIVNALNHGLSIATGRYIARMDSDDISLPERFEKQVSFLDDNPDYVACGTSIINFNQHGESFLTYPSSDDKIRVALSFFERNICHPTVMVRKEILDKYQIRYKTNYPHAEDYVFWIDLAKHGKLNNLDERLFKYHRHSDQVSSKYYDEQMNVSKTIVREGLINLWGDKFTTLIPHVVSLCVHKGERTQGDIFPYQQAKSTIKQILSLNRILGSFDERQLKKVLYFKRFRCSFYYQYSYFRKLKCFLSYLCIEPKTAIIEMKMFVRLFLLHRLKIKQ